MCKHNQTMQSGSIGLLCTPCTIGNMMRSKLGQRDQTILGTMHWLFDINAKQLLSKGQDDTPMQWLTATIGTRQRSASMRAQTAQLSNGPPMPGPYTSPAYWQMEMQAG